jgi:hypothetical protein
LKHEKRVNQDKIDALSIDQSSNQAKVRELRREVELIDDQLNTIPSIYHKRTITHQTVNQAKQDAANALGDAMINQSINVDTREHAELQMIEQKKQQLIEVKAHQQELVQLEKRTRAYAKRLIHERQEAEKCMIKLVEDAQQAKMSVNQSVTQLSETEEIKECDSPVLPTYYSDLSGDQREKLVKILFYRLMRHRSRPRHMVNNSQIANEAIVQSGDYTDDQRNDVFLDQTLVRPTSRARAATSSTFVTDPSSHLSARLRSGTAPTVNSSKQKPNVQFAATINM